MAVALVFKSVVFLPTSDGRSFGRLQALGDGEVGNGGLFSWAGQGDL